MPASPKQTVVRVEMKEWPLAALLVFLTSLCLIPLFLKDHFPKTVEIPPAVRFGGLALIATLPALVLFMVYFGHGELSRRERLTLMLLTACIGVWMSDLHYSNVDLQQYFAHTPENVQWQIQLHEQVLQLSPDVIPHSYRFLPDGIVSWFQLFTGKYLVAALLYRLTFALLLMDMIYRYARRYVDHRCAIVSLLLYALAYPISLRFYAGQLTDPLSHLSFVAAFYFLDSRRFLLFSVTVLVGLMAKESIVVMPMFWLIVSWKESKQRYAAILLLAACMVLTIAIRAYVCSGMSTVVVNDINPSYAWTNLSDFWAWSRQCWNTFGILVPFVCLGWTQAAPRTQQLILFLLPCLWISSLLFSFLKESRNYMPVVVPMAVVASSALLRQSGPSNHDPRTVTTNK